MDDVDGLGRLSTEARNPATRQLDTMDVPQILAAMNEQDATVAARVADALPAVARAVELVVAALQEGGRLIYLGAGTSGRLGVLDAVECPPTFDTDPGRVVGLIAGGEAAVRLAVEGAEDDTALAAADLAGLDLGPSDVVVGLSASGRTPYVVAGLTAARERGAATVAVSCNRDAAVSAVADVAVEVDTGPEVLTGSTRLKAGTATKMVCNMISTAAMVRLGTVYENLMIDMRPTNRKLAGRAVRIVAEATGRPVDAARPVLEQAGGDTRTAIVALLAGTDVEAAAVAVQAAGGSVRDALVRLASSTG